jgi:hypothetical protein
MDQLAAGMWDPAAVETDPSTGMTTWKADDGPPPPAEPAAPVPRVQLGPFSVPLPWVLSWAKPGCNLCDGRGFVKLAGQKNPELCGCAKVRAGRKLEEFRRAKAAPTPIDPLAAQRDAREQERLDLKVRSLRRAVDELEGELASRSQRSEASLAAEVAACSAFTKAEQDAASAAVVSGGRVTTLQADIGELERQLGQRRELLRELQEINAEAVVARCKATSDRSALETGIARARATFEKNTTGLRKEIAKARRRLDAALMAGGEGG